MELTNKISLDSQIDYKSKEAYNNICALTNKAEDRMALQRAKRERAIALDRDLTMTADLRRKIKAISDRLLETLVKYEDYIAKALTAYANYNPSPDYIEITFRISGDKDHRHLKYPDWYYEPEHKTSRQQRLQIVRLEKEMASEPNWVDVNDALYNEDYRSDQTNSIPFTCSLKDGRGYGNGYGNGMGISRDIGNGRCTVNWLKLKWNSHSGVRISDIIAYRAHQMDKLSGIDEDGICEALYRLKDIYCLAWEDMLDITQYKVDLHAQIINY